MCQQRAAEELCERVSRSVGRPIRLGQLVLVGIVPKGGNLRVLADLHRVAQAMTCDHGRETVVQTGRPRKPGGGNPTSGVGPEGGKPPPPQPSP